MVKGFNAIETTLVAIFGDFERKSISKELSHRFEPNKIYSQQ